MELKVPDTKKYSLKPDIRVGSNYYFQWNTGGGFGLEEASEINSLKNFIRKLIPVLEQFMQFLQKENKNSIDKKDPFFDKKQLCIKEKHNKKISFLMTIDSQGSTFFYREEKCSIVGNSNSEKMKGNDSDDDEVYLLDTDKSNNSIDPGITNVELKWILGELLFDRQKKQNQKQ